MQLSAEVLPAEATFRDVIWTSRNPKIATVDANGMVAGVAKGSVYIDATATRLLAAGDRLYSNQPTRVYQRPNTACSYIDVPRGIDVTFVAMSGRIVQVQRNGVTGYMLIDHLSARPGSLVA